MNWFRSALRRFGSVFKRLARCLALDRYARFKWKLNERVFVGKGTVIDSQTKIGDHSYIGSNCNITRAKIGRYCSIANNVTVGPGEHDLSGVSTNTIFVRNPYDLLTQKDCMLGNDVWVGVGAIIRRGVCIGNGAVVGANSYVNRDIPPYAVCAGSPARIIKYRFTIEEAALIDAEKWWDLEPKAAALAIERVKGKLSEGKVIFQ